MPENGRNVKIVIIKLTESIHYQFRHKCTAHFGKSQLIRP
jgi:hypothetical protein